VLIDNPDAAAWVVSDPRGGELSACEVDLDAVINNALAAYRWTARSGWKSAVHEGRHMESTVDSRGSLSQPGRTVERMTSGTSSGKAPRWPR
jgi:hypothetical protein